MERVDILLATFNGEKYLSEQLDSILAQTYDNFRILISDDFSTDNTKKIIKEYASKDKRIEYFFQEKNLGIVKNFAFLLEKVNSNFFMFSDQDDIWKKDKIEKSYKKQKEKNASLIYSDLEVVDENLNIIYESYWKLKGFYKKIKKYNSFESLYLNNYITGCTIFAKSSIISNILPFPENSKYILHDYWLTLMVSQNEIIDYIEEPLMMYRQHKNNKIGSKKRSDLIDKFEDLRNLFIDVKIDHFSVFVENNDRFKLKEIQNLNVKSLEYFQMLKNKETINFKGWILFYKLYKYESFSYAIQNFAILNLPCIARFLFKLKK